MVIARNGSARSIYAIRSATRLGASLALALGPAIVLLAQPGWLSLWWLVPAWALQTVGLTGLSNGAHEAVHGHLFYRPALDRLTGRLLHGLLLLNHDVHRQYHLTHHANTGNDYDPEGVFDFNNLGSMGGYLLRLGRWAVPPSPLHVLNWTAGAKAVIGRESGLLGKLAARRAAAGFVVPIAVCAGLAFWISADPRQALAGAFIPLIIFFPVYAYITALPEHFGLAERDARDRTRNVRTAPLLQYLLWNFNLHAVHHGNPHLHFSVLPAGVDKVQAPTADGYLRFHADIVRNLVAADRIEPEALGVHS